MGYPVRFLAPPWDLLGLALGTLWAGNSVEKCVVAAPQKRFKIYLHFKATNVAKGPPKQASKPNQNHVFCRLRFPHGFAAFLHEFSSFPQVLDPRLNRYLRHIRGVQHSTPCLHICLQNIQKHLRKYIQKPSKRH